MMTISSAKRMSLARLVSPLTRNALPPSECLHIRMSESTCLESMYMFHNAVIVVFGPEYLREPTAEDTARLLAMNASRGFPGMLGSIDCMHWEWKNCPSAWQGQYKGHVRACTVILEVVASQDLWI